VVSDIYGRIKFEHLPEILMKSRCHPAQGQVLQGSINKVETLQFYRRVFVEAGDMIKKNVDKVFDILENKGVNLPLSMVRGPGMAGDGIPLIRVFRYKVSVLLRIIISKLRKMRA